MVYGVYANTALVHWSPAKIFGDEIRVCQSISSLRHMIAQTLHRLLDPLHKELAFPARLPTWIVAR